MAENQLCKLVPSEIHFDYYAAIIWHFCAIIHFFRLLCFISGLSKKYSVFKMIGTVIQGSILCEYVLQRLKLATDGGLL